MRSALTAFIARLSESKIGPPSPLILWLAGSALLTVLYWLIFAYFGPRPMPPEVAMSAAISNVAPLAVLAAATRAAMISYVMPRNVLIQTLAHLVLAPIFAVTWYFAVVLLQGLFQAADGQSVRLFHFHPVVLIWQSFQGLVIYALVVAVCYAVRGGREAAAVAFVDAPPPLERYLIRTEDEFVPIHVGKIVTIVGAQDYSEVTVATGGRHLVRMSLGEFGRRLDAHRFIRVHRSSIINLDHLDRLEPAGNGRMIAYLGDGQSVEVSRAGVQALRTFVV